ncbi:MAG: DNA gyrase inhibitor YacG [Hyphomicrobium sp.]
MADTASQSTARPCPICKSASVAAYKPFCSKRCADIDLGKWFNSSYAIPGAAEDDEADGVAKNAENDGENQR